jgi:LysM repeat protein
MRRSQTTQVLRQLRVLTLALTFGGLPTLVRAQQSDSTQSLKPGTVLHTVRPGDTLFDIARRYLGNPFRWPELFRANASQIANANLIYPGQKLYVGADGRPTFNPEGVAATAPDTDVTPTRAVQLGRPTAGQSVSMLDNSTLTGRTLRPTVRQGEMSAAPFLVPARTKLVGGELVSRADPTVVSTAGMRDQFQLFDEVDVLLPAGARAAAGQKFGVYQPGPELRHQRSRTRVMRPAGVIQVVALGTGRAARARVTAMYGNMTRGDLLMPLDVTPSPGTVRPQDVANGPVYDVAWVAGDVVLPTVQNYVVIALPKGATSKVGDMFELFEDGNPLTAGRRDVAPPNDVAQASVVKVTTEGATAIVVGHEQPAIRVGMRARLVSRMP